MSPSAHRSVRATSAALSAACATVLVLLVGMSGANAAVDGQWWLSTYQLAQANTISTGRGVTVAVIDGGVVDTLPDLQGQVLAGKNFSGSGNPHTDPGEGCDNADGGGCFSHGTQMALLIAGTGRGLGFQGVAPDATILPVKVSAGTDVDSTDSAIAQGIRWAVDNGAQVISISLAGGSSCDPDEGDAVKYAYLRGVIVVASSGNTGVAVSAPADCPGALAIAGSDEDAHHWSDSNHGPEVVLAAPYGGVQESLSQQRLIGAHGTSASTAIAAGYFALLKSHFPHDSWRQLVTRALWHAETDPGVAPGARQDDGIGYGVMLPYNALTRPTPATLANPVDDRFRKALVTGDEPGSGTPSTSDRPTASGSTATRSTAGAPVHGQVPGGSNPSASAASAGLAAHVQGIFVAALAVAVIGLVFLVWLVVRSRRGRSSTAR